MNERQIPLLENERIDDLNLKGLKIIQQTNGFCFGMDAVLLSNFIKVRPNFVGADLGTGTGIIPILILGKSNLKKIYAFEIQEEVADMAQRSVLLNGLEDRATVICSDLKLANRHIEKCSLDFVVSNPPYMKTDGLQNLNEKKKISRHEVKCSLEDIFVTAENLLKVSGVFYMVHRPNRLCDIFELCRKYRLEPKEMRMVYPYVGKAPNLVLLKIVKHGKTDLKLLYPLYVYEENRLFTKEIEMIYSKLTIEEN